MFTKFAVKSFVGSFALAALAIACGGTGNEDSIEDSASELQSDIDTPWVTCLRPQDARGCTVYYTKDLDGLAWTWGLGKGYVAKGTVLTAAARAEGSYLVLGMTKGTSTEYNVDAPAGAVRVVDTLSTDEASSPDGSKEWRRGRHELFTTTKGKNAYVAPAEPRSEAVDDAIEHRYCNSAGGCDLGYTHWLGRTVALPKKACGTELPVIVKASSQRQLIVSTPMISHIAESDPRFGRVQVISMDDASWGTSAGECPGDAPEADFVCNTQGVFQQPAPNAPTSQLVDVRVGKHPTYDRFVMEFSNAVPGYVVGRQDSAVFDESGSGAVHVAGSVGLNVVVNPASGWENGLPTYTGPSRFRGYDTLKEAASVQDFSGTLVWGLGLSEAACFRVTTLTSPARLVIDVKH